MRPTVSPTAAPLRTNRCVSATTCDWTRPSYSAVTLVPTVGGNCGMGLDDPCLTEAWYAHSRSVLTDRYTIFAQRFDLRAGGCEWYMGVGDCIIRVDAHTTNDPDPGAQLCGLVEPALYDEEGDVGGQSTDRKGFHWPRDASDVSVDKWVPRTLRRHFLFGY